MHLATQLVDVKFYSAASQKQKLLMMLVQALMKVLLIVCMGHFIDAQSNGDVRLVPVDDLEFEGHGRLEIYLDKEWGTFCAEGFNSYAGDAACRQLGYGYSVYFKKASDDINATMASNSTPIHVSTGYNQCSKSICDGPQHILRCYPAGFDPHGDSSCTHDDDIVLDCSISLLIYDGYYDTELLLNSDALNSTYRSSGVLEIFSNSAAGDFMGWSNICGTNFDENAANAACVQMGYTGALSYSTSASRSRMNDIWLDGVTCGEIVPSCLDSCFCYPQQRTAIECDSNNVVALRCTYDTNALVLTTCGSRSLCEETEKSFCPTLESKSYNLNIILGTVMSAIIVLLGIAVVGLLVYKCRPGRAGYQSFNNVST